MKTEDIIGKIFGKDFSDELTNPQPKIVTQKVFPSIKEFMQRTASDWMKHEFPDECHEHTFRNSAGKRCRVKFSVEIL